MNLFNFVKKTIIENRENDDLLYEYVLSELENEIIIKSLWAKSIAMSKGNNDAIKALYMQYRVQNIKDQFTKLNIAYNDLQKEILFNNIKSMFDNTSSSSPITENEQTKSEKPNNTSKFDDKSWGEIILISSGMLFVFFVILFFASK